jgi:alkylation response protein AidB-like acyl-CoA dehydrogenase
MIQSMLTPVKSAVRSAPSPADIVATAYGLVPYLRAEAAACESARRVSDRTIDMLTEAGLFDVVKPRRYGGYEMGWDVFSDAVIAIASGCGSTGWVYSVVGGHGPIVARFGTDFMDEMWGADPRALVSSSRRIAGEIAPAPGGYRGSGVASFSSGCLNADWVLVENMPVAGEARPLTLMLPVADIEILDTWHVIGLAGTGSHDFRFRDAFIPTHRTWFPGKAPHGEALDGPLYRSPHLGGPFALPSVVLGIAIAGLEHFAALPHKRTARQGGSMADQPSMQMRIGESAIEIDAARALLRAKIRELMATLSGEPVDLRGERAVLLPGGASPRYDQAVSTYIAHTAYGALNRLMIAAGAGQLSLSEPFQRCFRDALAGLQQPSNNWDNGRTFGGRELLDRLKPAPDAAAPAVHADAAVLRSTKQKTSRT